VEEQRRIAKVFDEYKKLIELQLRDLERMKELEKGLLQQMFV
jgi:restriction endonuclease S subunit